MFRSLNQPFTTGLSLSSTTPHQVVKKQHPALVHPNSHSLGSLSRIVLLLAASAAALHAGNDLWSGGGGDNNWNTAGNWAAASANRPPASGDALFFDGLAQLTANNNDSGFAFAGLTFNSTAGAFNLTGNALTLSGGLADNSPYLETINLPLAFDAAHPVAVLGGGSLTINGVISGSNYTLSKTGAGLLTLTGAAGGANTYGPTTIAAGSLLLDFSQGGSTPVADLVPEAALTLSGGALTVNGSATGANTQTFTSTVFPAAATALPGQNVISVTNGAGGGTVTLNLAGLSVGAGSSIVFNGPATLGLNNVTLPATGTINTTTAGQGPTTAGVYGLLAAGANNNSYATVGLYDWASTDTTGDSAGNTIIGGSQVPGFYVIPANNANLTAGQNLDIATQQTPAFGGTSNVRLSSGTQYADTVRFNTGHAPYITVKSGTYFFSSGGVLVTPNMQTVNCGIDNLRVISGDGCQVVQNNTAAVLCLGLNGDGPFWSNGNNANDAVVFSGAGSVFLNPGTPMHIAFNYLSSTPTTNTSTSTYYDSAQGGSLTWGAFYLNGGVTVINNPNALGNPTGAQPTAAGGGGTVNLNGGTLMAATTTANAGTVNLINPATTTGNSNRPVFIGGNGGGLAAQSGTTLIVGGVVGSAAGTGPLTIGIPASSANNNTVGLAPGTGAGTPNPAFYGTGTVVLTNANYYYGGTILQSGTLNFNGLYALGGANYGGVIFKGGTLQYVTNFPGLNGSADLTSVGTAGVTLAAGGGTVDVNGNAISFASPIGNGGSGALTVKSTAAGGLLTLNGANTYTGNTIISGGTLKLAAGSALLSQNINVGNGSTFDVSASAYTLAAGHALLGGGAVTGNVAVAGSAMIIPGTLGTTAALSFSNNLTLSSGETNFFDLSATPGGSNDTLIVAGTLTLPASGKSVIAINFTAAPGVGRYKLITYGSLAGGTVAANLATNAFTGGSIGSLLASLDASIPGEIDLVLSNPHTPTRITWLGDGVQNNWDKTSANWTNIASLTLTPYYDFDYVTFDDQGSTNPPVNLTAALSPSSVTVSSTNNYTFSGSGLIGYGSLTKSNTDTLTILTTNTLPGPVVIQGGVLQVGNGTTSGAIGGGSVTNNAALVIDSPATVATGPITGTGNTTVIVGTLAIGGNSTLGALTLGSSDGTATAGTLDLAGNSATVTGLTLGADGTGGTIGSSGSGAATLYYTGGNSSAYAGVLQDTLGAGSGTVALNVNATGTLTLSGANNYSGGTVISSGAVSFSAIGNLGTGPVSLPGGTLTCTAGDTTAVVFNNALTVPTGTGGTFNMSPRLQLSPVTGGGTFNLNVTGPTVDYDRLAGGWGGFTGTLNITGTGGATVNKLQGYFNGGGFDGNLANAVVNLDDVSLESHDNSGGNTFQIGALSGTATAVLAGSDYAGSQTYQVGALNLNTTFAGTITDGNGIMTYVKKVGTGSLTLSGASTYTGSTTISNGTLIVTGSLGSSQVTNYSGATLAGTGTLGGPVDLEPGSTITSVVGGYGTMACGSDLIFDGGTNLVAISTTNVDLITVAGTLYLNSGFIQLAQHGALTNGTYPLMTYSGLNGSIASLTLVGFSSASGQIARLDSSISGQINLVVQNTSAANLIWASTGAQNNIWDVGASVNWSNGASLTVFNPGNRVTFNDSGAPNSPVQIAAVELPSAMVVTGSMSYVFQDAGGTLAGPTNSLTVGGTGSLEIDTVNSYGGPTTIGSGYTLTLGNGSDGASLGAGAVTNNGTLIFNQTNNVTLTNIIGTGSLAANGSGTISLVGTYNYTGATTIGSSATLQVGTGGPTGPLLGPVTDNGTLTMNQSGTVAINNAITGAGAFIQNGTSLMTLNAANTYQGNTYINHGVLKAGVAGVIPNAVTVPGSIGWFILDGNATNAGTFDLNGFDATVNLLQGLTGTVLGDITNSAAAATTTNILTFGNDFTTGTNGYAGLITENTAGAKIGLFKQGGSINILGGANSYSAGTVVANGWLLLQNNTAAGSGTVTLSNGATLGLLPNGSASIFVGNSIETLAGAEVTNYSSSLGCAFTGSFFSDDANGTNVIAGYVSLNNPANKEFEGFTGTVQISPGSQLRCSATALGTNGGDYATFDVEGTLNTRNGTPDGPGISLGALTGAGYVTGAGNAAGSTTYIIGAKGIDSVFSGTLEDGGNGNLNLVKVGADTLTLNGTVSYTGNTTVSNGVLALVDPVSLDASPTINLGSATATVDVSGRGDDTLNLGNLAAQTLSGIGHINGNLAEAANSSVRVGLGTLAVANAATFNGSLTLQLNRTNASTHSQVTAAGLTFAGPLTVTNIGPALQGGDTFQLFNTAVTGFTVTNLPVLPNYMYWTNKLAVNGSIAVISTVNPNPTNLVYNLSGNTLSLSWPADHIGWTLQVQTNSLLGGLGTNWVDVPGSAGINATNITVNPALPTVFYRLRF